jgi:hypothetical protein
MCSIRSNFKRAGLLLIVASGRGRLSVVSSVAETVRFDYEFTRERTGILKELTTDH